MIYSIHNPFYFFRKFFIFIEQFLTSSTLSTNLTCHCKVFDNVSRCMFVRESFLTKKWTVHYTLIRSLYQAWISTPVFQIFSTIYYLDTRTRQNNFSNAFAFRLEYFDFSNTSKIWCILITCCCVSWYYNSFQILSRFLKFLSEEFLSYPSSYT